MPQHSIKYFVVCSSIFTLYALHIFLILLTRSGNFNSLNSIISDYINNDIIGINKKDAHMVGGNWGSEFELPEIVTDIRLVEAGELCLNAVNL